MADFDRSKLKIASPNALKVFESNCNRSKREEVALRITCIKNFKFKFIKTRTGCQYVGCFYYSINLKRAAQNLRLGCMRAAGWT